MLKLLHTADVHLTDKKPDRDYALNVLREIVGLAETRNCDGLLIAGDLFDTSKIIGALLPEVRSILQTFQGLTIFVPGNHEYSVADFDLDQYDWSGLELMAQPWQRQSFMLQNTIVEFLALPHGTFSAHRSMSSDSVSDTDAQTSTTHNLSHSMVLPEPAGPVRIAIAHGIVTGMAFTGPDEEQGATAIEPELLIHNHCDYVALGHIHRRRMEWLQSNQASRISETEGIDFTRSGPDGAGSLFAYPGSPRVWRKGESGVRSVLELQIELDEKRGNQLKVESVPLESAGQYREIQVPLQLDGRLPEIDSAEWDLNDRVLLRLEGFVDNESILNGEIQKLKQSLTESIRELDVESGSVQILGGIAQEPLAKEFLEAWQHKYDQSSSEREQQLWMRARNIALTEIKKEMDKRVS